MTLLLRAVIILIACGHCMISAGQRVGNNLKIRAISLRLYLKDEIWILICQYLTVPRDYSLLPTLHHR